MVLERVGTSFHWEKEMGWVFIMQITLSLWGREKAHVTNKLLGLEQKIPDWFISFWDTLKLQLD